MVNQIVLFDNQRWHWTVIPRYIKNIKYKYYWKFKGLLYFK